jgi:hypothetical protein
LPQKADEFNARSLAHIFDSFQETAGAILIVCDMLPGNNNLTSGCHGDSKTANFSSAVCSPTGEAGKNADIGDHL